MKNLPRTVDEVVDLLVHDLLIQHINTLLKLDEEGVADLCKKLKIDLEEEFRIYTGNEALLANIRSIDKDADPAEVVIKRLIESFKLNDIVISI